MRTVFSAEFINSLPIILRLLLTKPICCGIICKAFCLTAIHGGLCTVAEVDLDKSIMTARLFDYYGGLLSDRQRQIISLHYDEDLSLSEIASICGITRQGVLDAMKKAEAALADCEEKLGFMKRADALADAISSIADRVEEADSAAKRREAAELLRNIQF